MYILRKVLKLHMIYLLVILILLLGKLLILDEIYWRLNYISVMIIYLLIVLKDLVLLMRIWRPNLIYYLLMRLLILVSPIHCNIALLIISDHIYILHLMLLILIDLMFLFFMRAFKTYSKQLIKISLFLFVLLLIFII
jgi:hypothetical protein